MVVQPCDAISWLSNINVVGCVGRIGRLLLGLTLVVGRGGVSACIGLSSESQTRRRSRLCLMVYEMAEVIVWRMPFSSD